MDLKVYLGCIIAIVLLQLTRHLISTVQTVEFD